MELDTSEYVLESILDFVYTGKIIALQAMGKEEVKQIWRIGEYLKAKPLLHYLFRERPDVRPASPVNDQPLHSTTQKHCSDETESDPSSYSLTPSSSNLMIKNDNELESTQSNKQFSSSLPPSEVVKIEQTLICEEKDAFPSNYVNGKGLDEPISMMDCHRIEDEHLSSPRVEHCGDHLSPPTEQSRDQSICSKPTDVPPTLDTTLKLRNNLLQKLNGEQTSLTKTAIVSTRQVNTKRLKYTSKSHSHGSSAMPQHEEQDVELLRELKYLAPDAGIWNLLTDI